MIDRNSLERLAAYALIVAVAALGFWRTEVQQAQLDRDQQQLEMLTETTTRNECERSNRSRAEIIEASVVFARRLGVETEAPPERVEAAIERLRGDLTEALPQRDCATARPKRPIASAAGEVLTDDAAHLVTSTADEARPTVRRQFKHYVTRGDTVQDLASALGSMPDATLNDRAFATAFKIKAAGDRAQFEAMDKLLVSNGR